MYLNVVKVSQRQKSSQVTRTMLVFIYPSIITLCVGVDKFWTFLNQIELLILCIATNFSMDEIYVYEMHMKKLFIDLCFQENAFNASAFFLTCCKWLSFEWLTFSYLQKRVFSNLKENIYVIQNSSMTSSSFILKTLILDQLCLSQFHIIWMCLECSHSSAFGDGKWGWLLLSIKQC